MYNFRFQNPTELIFGKGMIVELSKRIPRGAKVLLTFGGGSVKRNGIYDDVIAQLKGYEYTEFWGIESNPTVQTIRQAVRLGKEFGATFILAVGGGSVLDASKLIANAVCSPKDAWQLVLQGADLGAGSLPLGTVLTIPATGSEMNRGAVISNTETHEKFGFYNQYPVFSILDPTYTYSLPDYQIACGIADTFVHVVEQYLTETGESPLMDRWAEGILLTLTEQAIQIKQNKEDYDSRANFMLCATMALNGMISMGVTQDWATHLIGHELTAFTGLTHGHTLAIILPALLRRVGLTNKREKLLQYGTRVWGITEGSEDERIQLAINKTEDFFRSLGLETRLSERGIGQDVEAQIVERFRTRGGSFGEKKDINAHVIAEILVLAR